MIKVVRWSALAGGAIPVFLLLSVYIELYLNINRIPVTVSYGMYLWPSWVILLGEGEEITIGLLISLSISILLNVFLYSFAGLLCGFGWERWSKSQVVIRE